MQLTDSNKEHYYELLPKEVRKFKGFEKLSDDECLELIHQLKDLSLILYNIYQRELEVKS